MNHILLGFNHLIAGFGLIAKPGIRPYVLIPVLLNVFTFVLLFLVLRHYVAVFNAWFDHYLPGWLHWLSYFLWLLFIASFFLLFLYTFVVIGNIISAPFNSFLAEKVQYELTGIAPANHGLMFALKAAPRAIARQAAILLYYVPRACLFLVLFFIPIVQLVAPVLWLAFNAWYMAIIYIDYPTDNNQVTFTNARNWLAANRAESFGLGLGMLVLSMIPGINIISMPTSVAAATRYWVLRNHQAVI